MLKLMNDGITTLETDIDSNVTEIYVVDGSVFPQITEQGDWFPLLLTKNSLIERLHVTSTDGNKLIVTRGAENTGKLEWLAGDSVSLVLTAAAIEEIQNSTNSESSYRAPITMRHRNGVQHSHNEDIKVSPVINDVDPTVKPKVMSTALLDTVTDNLYFGVGKKYTLLNDIVDSRYFALFSTHLFKLDEAYTGNVTIEYYPLTDRQAIHASCTDVPIPYQWNISTFSINEASIFFNTAPGVYFVGAVKSVTFTGGVTETHFELDQRTNKYIGASIVTAEPISLMEMVDKTFVRFYQRSNREWVSGNVVNEDKAIIYGDAIEQEDHTYTYTDADGESYVKVLPSEYAYYSECLIDINSIASGVLTTDDLSTSEHATDRPGRFLTKGIQGDKLIIKRASVNFTGVLTITNLNYVIGEF